MVFWMASLRSYAYCETRPALSSNVSPLRGGAKAPLILLTAIWRSRCRCRSAVVVGAAGRRRRCWWCAGVNQRYRGLGVVVAPYGVASVLEAIDYRLQLHHNAIIYSATHSLKSILKTATSGYLLLTCLPSFCVVLERLKLAVCMHRAAGISNTCHLHARATTSQRITPRPRLVITFHGTEGTCMPSPCSFP